MTETEEKLYVANTIKSQIGMLTLMRLGANELRATTAGENRGGLTFKASGPKLNAGRVTVTLDYDDTYTVWIENNRNKATLYKQSGVYAEMLRGPQGVIEQATG